MKQSGNAAAMTVAEIASFDGDKIHFDAINFVFDSSSDAAASEHPFTLSMDFNKFAQDVVWFSAYPSGTNKTLLSFEYKTGGFRLPEILSGVSFAQMKKKFPDMVALDTVASIPLSEVVSASDDVIKAMIRPDAVAQTEDKGLYRIIHLVESLSRPDGGQIYTLASKAELDKKLFKSASARPPALAI